MDKPKIRIEFSIEISLKCLSGNSKYEAGGIFLKVYKSCHIFKKEKI